MNKVILKNIELGIKDFDSFAPDIRDNFCVWLTLLIGPSNLEGGHDYNLGVCSPKWLYHNIQNYGPMWGRHLLIVEDFDSVKIRRKIDDIILHCTRETFEETSIVIGRYFLWEYEDYKS